MALAELLDLIYAVYVTGVTLHGDSVPIALLYLKTRKQIGEVPS